MENIKLKLINTKNIYGTMSNNSITLNNLTTSDKKMIINNNYLTENELQNYKMTKEDKDLIIRKHYNNFAKAYDIYTNHIVVAQQELLDGDWHLMNENFLKEIGKSNYDISSIREDIFIISKDVPNILVGHPVSDEPVVVIEDIKKNVAAVAYCGTEQINEYMPLMIIECMRASCQSSYDDLQIWISATASVMNNIYKDYPEFAKNSDVWKNCIIKGFDNLYRVDLKSALLNQFTTTSIDKENIHFDMTDTVTDLNHYSNIAAQNTPQKQGHQFVGAMYQKVKK